VHVEHIGQPGGLVDEVAARAPVPVDLLQADDLGTRPFDGRGDAREIQHTVEPDAVVDVERRHPQLPLGRHRPGAGRWRRSGRCGRADGGGQQ
jgi:hypothetical protein